MPLNFRETSIHLGLSHKIPDGLLKCPQQNCLDLCERKQPEFATEKTFQFSRVLLRLPQSIEMCTEGATVGAAAADFPYRQAGKGFAIIAYVGCDVERKHRVG